METHHFKIRSTTVLCICRGKEVVMASDGQVTMAHSIIKTKARKIQRLYHDKVLTGFAGATSDAFTLFERLECKLEEYSGNLQRAAVELGRDWRADKFLRNLEALLLASDLEKLLIISGTGDVIEPEDGIAAIGSGGLYALSAARALITHTNISAKEIAKISLGIAADICIYTNHNIIIDCL